MVFAMPPTISPDDIGVDRLLTSAEVCNILRIKSKTLQRLCKSGALNFIRISETCYRFRPAAVNLFLRQREIGPAKRTVVAA
jgi:excisionase family DNA binding protein